MYETTSLRMNVRSDVMAVGDTSTGHIINLLARVVAARNPLITAPPMESALWQAVGKPEAADNLYHALRTAIMDPVFLKAGFKVPTNLNEDGEIAPLLISVANLGLSSMLSFPRTYALDITGMKTILTLLQDEQKTSVSNVKIEGKGVKDIMEQDTLRVPFAMFALTFAYEQIVRSGVFDKLPPAEASAERAPFTIIERGLLLSTMMRMLAMQTLFLRVRPLLRYLRMPQSAERLREEMMPDNVAYWEAIIDDVLALPVHPWIARAEEPSLPMNRATPWGESTPTILLERGFLRAPWDGRNDPSAAQRRGYAAEMASRLDPPVLLASLELLLRDLRRFIMEVREDNRFTRVATVLGFTSPRGPMNIPMWGPAFRPVHTDGLNATEAVTDLIALSYQLHLPTLRYGTTPWVGEKTFVDYLGADRADSHASVWSENAATISIAPEDVIMDASFAAARFVPEMFQFMKDSYRGDLGAMDFPATIEGVANVLGKSSLELAIAVKAKPIKWGHIFTVEGDEITPVRKDERLFISERTQAPWLTSITLPRRGVPTVLWGFRRGLPDTAAPVMAQFIRNGELPISTVPMASAVDRLITDAIPGTHQGIK